MNTVKRLFSGVIFWTWCRWFGHNWTKPRNFHCYGCNLTITTRYHGFGGGDIW